MEKTHLFCKTEESINVSVHDSDSSTTNLSSRNIESKKYSKISKTAGKKNTSDTKAFVPEYKRIYETSLFLYREEKSTELSGSKKFKKKKSLQVQFHSKRTEIASPSLKLSKEKMTGKESTSHKVPCQFGSHKTSLPLPTTSSTPRRKEPISNLYMTLYEQMPEGSLKFQELSALPKACIIFSKVRQGKIYVNDLPMILHNLKISMSDSEMRQVLKTVDIDVNGILDFTGFLKARNDASQLASQDPEFQNVLKTFSKMKDGRVAVDEVAAFLDSMALPVNPETLKDIINHSYVDSNHTVDIGDIIFTLDELQQQYEDVSIMDEATSSKRLSNIPGHHVQPKKKSSSFSRLSEPLTSKKLNVPPFQYHSKSLEKHNEPEFKRSKTSLQTKRFSSRVDSDHVGFQEPSLKSQDSKSKLSILKSTSSLDKFPDKTDTSKFPDKSDTSKFPDKSDTSKFPDKSDTSKFPDKSDSSKFLDKSDTSKFLDKSDTSKFPDKSDTSKFLPDKGDTSKFPDKGDTSKFLDKSDTSKFPDKSDTANIPKLEKLTVRKQSSSLKPVSPKEKAVNSTLESVQDAISKLQGDYISPEELLSVLPVVEITLSDKDFQKIVPETTKIESGMVNLDDFIMAVSKEHNIPEYDALNDAIEGANKIQNENVAYEDLDTCLQNFGVYLPKPELEKIKELTGVDETKQVNLKEFIDNMMSNTECFSQNLLLPDAVDILHNLGKDKMDVSRLWDTLSSSNSHLKKDEFLDAVKSAIVDGDKVQLEEFSKAVKDIQDTRRLKEFQEIASVLSSLKGETIARENLEDFLKNLGITSFNEEVEKILQSDIVADNRMNVKDFMKALKDTLKFSNYTASKEAINKLDSMKGSSWSDKDKYLGGLENVEGLKKEVSSPHLKLPTVGEIKEAADILSHVDNGKISMSDLQRALKCLNANLTEEDFNKALERCDTSDNMEVDLKDFLMETKSMPSFKDSIVTQVLLTTPQVLQKDLLDVSDFKKLLENDGLHSAEATLTEVLKNVPEHEKGKVSIQDFLTTFADTLRTLKSEGEKERLYNTKIDRNDLNAISDIKQSLDAIRIHLTDDEIQKVLDNTTPSSDVVQFKDIIRELANSDIFNECRRIEDTCNVVDRITDGKIEVKALLPALESFKKSLQEKGQPGVFPTSEMDEREVVLKETIGSFVDSSSPATSFSSLLKEITAFDNIRNNTMPANELISNLRSAGIPISYNTMQEILRQASFNENDEVSVKQILENLSTHKPDSVLEDIQTALNTAKLMSSDKIQVANLKDAFSDLNIPLRPKEQQMLEKTLNADENGDISQRTALLALKSNKRLQDFREANELAKALSKLTSGKISIDDMRLISKGLGLHVPDEELQKLESNISVDKEGNVDLKDWLTKLKETPYFTKSSKMQGPLKTLASIRRNEASSDDVLSILKNMGIVLPQDVIETALNNVTPRENGTLDLVEFLNHLIKSQLSSAPEREKIDASTVDEVLKDMDLTLNGEEEQILFEHFPAPDDEEVDMETFIGAVKMLKVKVDVANLHNFLDDMGVELSGEDYDELVNHLPVHVDKKISQLELIDTIKTFKRGKVDTTKLDNALEKMGVELTNKELQHLQEHLPVDTDGKVHLNILLDEIDRLKKEKEKIDVSDLDTILEKMGMDFSDETSGGVAQNWQVQLSKPLGAVPRVSGKKSRQTVSIDLVELNLTADF
ncbi:EF-hand calcium-binding domain-containing protein 13 [Peromyscus eremicus]|uniref:EF-hand calcium-binding domain-containing protein 13 n=1 Tax=Peromyscus eremicus TaxID=42410 RepID=UPI0027DCCCE5|nr:EF-hand calcium-binding domain-containing protein 13 [Peromyscus eremicus]